LTDRSLRVNKFFNKILVSWGSLVGSRFGEC
jgi:hypothetical protein